MKCVDLEDTLIEIMFLDTQLNSNNINLEEIIFPKTLIQLIVNNTYSNIKKFDFSNTNLEYFNYSKFLFETLCFSYSLKNWLLDTSFMKTLKKLL